MAESVSLTAQPRSQHGSSNARRLRRKGQVPGILYGHKLETVPIALTTEDMEKAIRQGARVVQLQLGGKQEQALIQQIQWDHLGIELMHIDFKRVSKDERVVVNVRLELRGHSPGVTAGGVLDQPLHSLSVECLALSVPESIRVNISELKIDDVIHVKDLVLPEGVKSMADPDAVVLQVKPPELEEAAPAAPTAEGAAAAEPEVIGRKAAEEEEEEKEEKK
jgi:large subunit ribosomal protein L25